MTYAIRLILLLAPFLLRAQPPVQKAVLSGRFLTDSIEIGRPFQYSLVYRHPAATDALFPDTARSFAPYRVKKVAVFATQTMGDGAEATSRDSAVYTLLSFETDSVQLLKVPVRAIHKTDCTAQWTQTDTVFLRSKLPVISASDSIQLPAAPELMTETDLAPLQQQFNYAALAVGFILIGLAALVLYGLFGETLARYWKLYRLNRNHRRFLNEYNQLTRDINAYTAADTANQAIMMWKGYLEYLDEEPYTSLTTPELAERMNDDRILTTLREVDRMIYGGNFSPESLPALRVLSEVATNSYHRHRTLMQNERASFGTPSGHRAPKPSVP